jgi:hypothetical protein
MFLELMMINGLLYEDGSASVCGSIWMSSRICSEVWDFKVTFYCEMGFAD